jgi:hypothetical protein
MAQACSPPGARPARQRGQSQAFPLASRRDAGTVGRALRWGAVWSVVGIAGGLSVAVLLRGNASGSTDLLVGAGVVQVATSAASLTARFSAVPNCTGTLRMSPTGTAAPSGYQTVPHS